MTRLLSRLLAVCALLLPVALFAVPASAASPATPESRTLSAESSAAMEILDASQAGQLFDEQEMAELAALESQHLELQEQQAGFFGPRLGTIIIIGLALIILL